MKCSDPVLVRRSSAGKRVFRNFSLSDPIFKMSHDEVFSCGRCLFCRKSRAKQLAVRCVLHASMYPDNCFLTLTYDESREGYHNVFEYSDIQKFKKRLRSYVWRRFKRRIEVFNVHEYGKRGKKHWHLICFGFDFNDKLVHTVHNGIPLYTSDELRKIWPLGFSTVGSVEFGSALYQAQYMEKDFKNGYVTSAKKSHSKHSGIGRPFFLKHYRQILSLGFIPFGGRKFPVFRYFEKLAHKHWCHFFEPSAFEDYPERKRIYTRFKPGQADLDIAEHFARYKLFKDEKVLEMKEVWDDFMSDHLKSGSVPDFVSSGSNALYDLVNSKKFERF